MSLKPSRPPASCRSVGMKKTLRCLEALWLKRDGAASWELAEAYIRVLIENPSLFISHVAAKHELYQSWLENIDEYNFRAFNNDTKRLKDVRRKALKSLGSVRPKDSAHVAVKRELIAKIQKAKITSVD